MTSGTWTGPGTSWNVGTNWSSNPTVPDEVATFTNNAAPTSLNVLGATTIGEILFTATAPAYSITVMIGLFTVNGVGIVNNSSQTQSFVIQDTMEFAGGSSAGPS